MSGADSSSGKVVEVGLDALPDVVLEVDNTTDVRRGKLGLYESWGFPEVWVVVPDEPEPNRPSPFVLDSRFTCEERTASEPCR